LTTPLGKAVIHTFHQAEPIFGEEDIIAIIKQIDPAEKLVMS